MTITDLFNSLSKRQLTSQETKKLLSLTPSLQENLVAHLTQTIEHNNKQLTQLWNANIPVDFIVEYIATTGEEQQAVANRWLKPFRYRFNYKPNIFDTLSYFGVLFFSSILIISFIIEAIWNVSVLSTAGLIACGTVVMFVFFTDLLTWTHNRTSFFNVQQWLMKPLTNLEQQYLQETKTIQYVKRLNSLDPALTHLVSHFSPYELHVLLQSSPEQMHKIFALVPPCFKQRQKSFAPWNSYGVCLLKTLIALLPGTRNKNIKRFIQTVTQ